MHWLSNPAACARCTSSNGSDAVGNDKDVGFRAGRLVTADDLLNHRYLAMTCHQRAGHAAPTTHTRGEVHVRYRQRWRGSR